MSHSAPLESWQRGVAARFRTEVVSQFARRPHGASQVTLDDCHVNGGGRLAEILHPPRPDLSKLGKKSWQEIFLKLYFDLSASDLFWFVELKAEFALPDATLVHRDGIPPRPVKERQMLDIPGKKVSAAFRSRFVESILHEPHVRGGMPLLAAGQFHLATKGELASAFGAALVNTEVLPLLTAATEAFNVRGPKGQIGFRFEKPVTPF